MEDDKVRSIIISDSNSTEERILSLEKILFDELKSVLSPSSSEGLFVSTINDYINSNSFCDKIYRCPEMLTLIKTIYNQEVSKKKLEEELMLSREDALTDSLSGLFNRRIFDREIDVLYNDFVRNKREVSIVYLDFDNFKNLNDTYSHQAGDEVIKTFGKMLLSKLKRKSDWACRLGGEEFALLLPDTNLKNSINFVENIRKRLKNHYFYFEDEQGESKEISQTISYGIGQFSNQDFSAQEHLKLIDKSLYKSKSSGRNQGFILKPLVDPSGPEFESVFDYLKKSSFS